MKRVVEHSKLLGVDKNVTLAELKTIYRNTMKDSHPDKFINDEAGKLAAEEKSRRVIEAYHFLVSINKETHEKHKEEYTETISNSLIHDFYFEKQIFKNRTFKRNDVRVSWRSEEYLCKNGKCRFAKPIC